jgi:hypothetical protein
MRMRRKRRKPIIFNKTKTRVREYSRFFLQYFYLQEHIFRKSPLEKLRCEMEEKIFSRQPP